MTLNILIVPGYRGSGEAHWQSWLESQMPEAKRVQGIDWDKPIVHNWAKEIVRTLDENPEPTIIIAHSFGCLASAMAIANRPQQVVGAILVAPANPERFGLFGARDEQNKQVPSIAQYLPVNTLNTCGLIIGSQNDPWMKLEHAYAWSQRWKLGFFDAGAVGHINVESGFGPWPLIKTFTLSLSDILQTTFTRKENTESVFLPEPEVFTFNQQKLLYA